MLTNRTQKHLEVFIFSLKSFGDHRKNTPQTFVALNKHLGSVKTSLYKGFKYVKFLSK